MILQKLRTNHHLKDDGNFSKRKWPADFSGTPFLSTLLVFAMLCFCGSLSAQLVTFNGAATGPGTMAAPSDWTVPGNWSTGMVPGPNNDVVITGNVFVVIPAGAVITVESVEIKSGGDLIIDGTLNVGSDDGSGTNGSLDLDSTSGTVTNNGTINATNNDEAGVYVKGTFTNNGIINIDGAGTDGLFVTASGSFINNGDISITDVDDDHLAVASGTTSGTRRSSSFVNNGNIVIDAINGDEAILVTSGSIFTNNGDIDINLSGAVDGIVVEYGSDSPFEQSGGTARDFVTTFINSATGTIDIDLSLGTDGDSNGISIKGQTATETVEFINDGILTVTGDNPAPPATAHVTNDAITVREFATFTNNNMVTVINSGGDGTSVLAGGIWFNNGIYKDVNSDQDGLRIEDSDGALPGGMATNTGTLIIDITVNTSDAIEIVPGFFGTLPGTFTNSGILESGCNDTTNEFEIRGTVDLGTSTFVFDITGDSAGSDEFDQIDLQSGSSIDISGVTAMIEWNYDDFDSDDCFKIVDGSGTVTGEFVDIIVSDPEITFTTTYSASEVEICVCELVVDCSMVTDQELQCLEDIPAPDFNLITVTDSCGAVMRTATTVVSGNAGCADDPITATRTYTLEDPEGNVEECVQVFTIADTTPPMISCPTPVSGSCTDPTDPGDTGLATATDNCTPDGEIVIVFADESTQAMNGCGASSFVIVRTWTATDACGNSATCSQNISVADTTPPTITCPADVTSASCTDSTLPADTGVATATDDCSSEMEIMIMSSDSSTQAAEGCGAISFTIFRTFTATDACGNTATCVQSISVGDTEPPMVTCPPDQMMVACDSTALPIATTIDEFIAIGGTVSDDCSPLEDLSINVFNDPPSLDMLDFCPGAPVEDRTLIRTYQITDICGNVGSCEQTFIYAPSSTDPVITAVPQDQTVDCIVNAIPQLALFVAEGDCSDITYTVSDPVSSGTAGCSGSTIQYTYTATDECGRSVSTVQTYTLENEGPQFVAFNEICVIDCPADLAARQVQFDEYAERANINSSCSESSISITNNFNQNGFTNQNCLNPTVAIDKAIAFQVVTFTATDACGRSGTETAMVVIVDNEGPEFTSSASSGVASCDDADLQGGFTAWANTQLGILSATDGCSGGAVSFSYAPLAANVDCSSGTAITEVAFTATDACGNATTTMANYVIVDEGPGEPAMATVSGTLRTEEFETIESVEVAVDGYMNNSMTTNSDGYYHFDLLASQNYAIAPSRNDDPLNGISTYDLVLLGQHLLEINTLDSPYKLIAADVNESGSITALDLIELRRLILQIDAEFTSGKSWTFVDAEYIFPQPTNPFATTYPTIYNINNLTTGAIADFVGIKLGDLNASANPVALQSGDTRSSDGTLNIRLNDEQLKAGQTYDLAFTAEDFKDVAGFQFTLDYAADYLEVVDYEGSELDKMSADNFGFTRASQGQITVSWNDVNAVSLSDDATLFTMSFTALKDVQLSEVLAISSSVTASEAYQADLRKEVALDFGKTIADANGFSLLQNRPNPFNNETLIAFNLPEATTATLTIYDVAGRIIKAYKGDFSKGYNELTVTRADLSGTGLLYYQLKTPTDVATMKMIVR